MKNPPRSLLRAIQKAQHGKNHVRHDTRHGGLTPDPLVYAPVVPAMQSHGGINKDDVKNDIPVRVTPYGSIAIGDVVNLYVNDQYVAYDEVVDINATLALFIDPFYIAPDATEISVHYHVRDASDNERSSQVLTVPVKLTAPGNPPEPPDANDPSLNPRLEIPYGVPTTITDAVGDLDVIIVQYANQRVGDVITVSWAGMDAQYGPLTTADLNRSVTVNIPNSLIVSRPGTDLVVRYSIRDKVQNYSRYSPSVLTTVYARGSLLEPTVEGTQSGDLFIDDITDGQIEVRVNRHADIATTDDIVVHWTGRPAEGPFQDFSTPPQQLGSNRFLNFQVPKDIAQVLIDSQAYVYYTAIPAAGGAAKTSSGSTFGVIGTRNELKAPEVPKASGGTLTPEAISESTVEVIVLANPLLVSGSTVTLIWSGNGQAGTVYYEQQRPVDSGNAGGPMSFLVPKDKAVDLIGGRLEVSFTVKLSDNTVYRSPVLALTVTGAGALLPAATFRPALKPGDVLDPADLTAGGITVKFAVSSPLYVGGKARLHWDGSSSSINPPLELPITAVGELSFWIDKARYVDPNLNGTVNVWYDLIPTSGATGVSSSVLLSVQDAASQTWPAPQIHDHTGGAVSVWNPVRTGSQANTATFVLRDARLQVGDRVAPLWLLPDESDVGVDTIGVTTAGEVRSEIPLPVMAESLNKIVKVSYLPLLADGPGPLSETLNLRVLALPPSALSELSIVEAANGGAGPELDVDSLTGNATVRVGQWPLIAQRQSVWLTLSGTRQDGSPYHKQLMGPPSIVDPDWVSAGSQTFTVPAGELKELRDASSLTLTLKVDVAGGTNEAAAVVFTPKIYTVRSTGILLAPPEVLEAPDWTLDFATVHTARYITVRARISTGAFQADPQATYTVMVRWVHEGLVYHSDIVETTVPRTLDFQIPRLEVIDVIGSYADINYTVYGNGLRLSSNVRRLYVTGQDIALPAPRFNSASNEVTVLYPAQLDGHRVTVRWTGVTAHDTAEQPVQTGVIARFPIPTQWLTENAGNVVLINYSVLRRTGELRLFSRLLRLQL